MNERIQPEPFHTRLIIINAAVPIADDGRSKDIVDTASVLLIQELQYRGYRVSIGLTD